jgi:hypothetical protein
MNILLSRRSKSERKLVWILFMNTRRELGLHAKTQGTVLNLGAQANARSATQVLDRGAQVDACGAAELHARGA